MNITAHVIVTKIRILTFFYKNNNKCFDVNHTYSLNPKLFVNVLLTLF